MPETLARRTLAAAVERLGGQPREGQQEMVDAVAQSLESGEHLLVQAGTGTGKSLGYLIPALVAVTQSRDRRVVVATATLALQAQLATKDIPAAVTAVEKVTGRTPKTAIVKGRSNYACLYRVRSGVVDDQDALFGGGDVAEALRESSAGAESVLGAEVVALREWVEQQADDGALADRDDAPVHSPKAWAQISVGTRECLGAQRCPFGEQCFTEKSRAIARDADLVVTNHALLAIDAMNGGNALPEHDAVIIDEAHELAQRVTGAASMELSPQLVERVARRCLTWIDDDLGMEFLEAADDLRDAFDQMPLERVTQATAPAALACARVRDVARRVVSGITGDKESAERVQAQASAKEIFDIAERMARLDDADVVWISEREHFGRQAVVAPLSVAGLMREKVLKEATTILTSATLKLGGDFSNAAGAVGLRRNDDMEWRGIDVGSPFDYRRQGILYVARELPAPTRDGISEATLAEVAELVWAAGGRTLGLFASQRSAEAAAVYTRRQLPKQTILCQGDAQLADLVRRFIADPHVSLFGTLSLWQGIDVPGDSCELVIIDKIPFPRPDDPLMMARQQAVAEAGGNGFMSVAATHAALLLAQGSGRLIRRSSDRGVVAVLDPRLATARYGGFLRNSMPPLWQTTDREVAVQALRRLADAHQG